MKIGIVNAGNVGLTLAPAWLRAGHTVFVSKDTHPEQLSERVRTMANTHNLTESERSSIQQGTLEEAARFSDVVVFAAYFPRFAQVIQQLRAAGITFDGATVIDTTNPLNVDANFNHYHDLEYMARTSTSEDLARAFPGAKVVKAFSTVPAEGLDAQRWDNATRPTLLHVGGDEGTDRIVRALIADAGFKPASAGHDLQDARLFERLGILLHRFVTNEFDGALNLAFSLVRPPL